MRYWEYRMRYCVNFWRDSRGSVGPILDLFGQCWLRQPAPAFKRFVDLAQGPADGVIGHTRAECLSQLHYAYRGAPVVWINL